MRDTQTAVQRATERVRERAREITCDEVRMRISESLREWERERESTIKSEENQVAFLHQTIALYLIQCEGIVEALNSKR